MANTSSLVLVQSLEELAGEAMEYVRAAKAAATLAAYQSDWRDFEAWSKLQGLVALPAEATTVALYLAHLASNGRKVATMTRRLSSISQAHKAAGFTSPTSDAKVKTVMAGIRRKCGVRQVGKQPVLIDDLRVMVEALPNNVLGVRDRVLLTLGLATALRRSELVGLDVEDITFTSDGLVVFLKRSKTDQTGEGRQIGVPWGSRPQTCPVRSLRQWLEASGISEGPIFRYVDRHGNLHPGRLSAWAVGEVVKRYARAIGRDPVKFGGHSLRAGHATSAALGGAPERVIANQTGHKSMAMLRRYIRNASLFQENSASYVGL